MKKIRITENDINSMVLEGVKKILRERIGYRYETKETHSESVLLDYDNVFDSTALDTIYDTMDEKLSDNGFNSDIQIIIFFRIIEDGYGEPNTEYYYPELVDWKFDNKELEGYLNTVPDLKNLFINSIDNYLNYGDNLDNLIDMENYHYDDYYRDLDD